MRILLYVFGWMLLIGGATTPHAESIFAGVVCLLLGAILSARKRARKASTTTVTTIVSQTVD